MKNLRNNCSIGENLIRINALIFSTQARLGIDDIAAASTKMSINKKPERGLPSPDKLFVCESLFPNRLILFHNRII